MQFQVRIDLRLYIDQEILLMDKKNFGIRDGAKVGSCSINLMHKKFTDLNVRLLLQIQGYRKRWTGFETAIT